MPHPQAAACASVGIIYISRVCRYHAFFTPRILCFSVFFKATNVTAERGAASCFSLSHRDTDSERVKNSLFQLRDHLLPLSNFSIIPQIHTTPIRLCVRIATFL
jgi:hypothetical protein